MMYMLELENYYFVLVVDYGFFPLLAACFFGVSVMWMEFGQLLCLVHLIHIRSRQAQFTRQTFTGTNDENQDGIKHNLIGFG